MDAPDFYLNTVVLAFAFVGFVVTIREVFRLLHAAAKATAGRYKQAICKHERPWMPISRHKSICVHCGKTLDDPDTLTERSTDNGVDG